MSKKKSYHHECPVRVKSHFPVLTFQIFTDLSQLPLPKDAPPGLQTTDVTLRFDEISQQAKQLDKRRKLDKTEKKKTYQFECPVSVDWHSKVPAETTVHIFIVASSLPVASLVLSLFHDTERTLRFR